MSMFTLLLSLSVLAGAPADPVREPSATAVAGRSPLPSSPMPILATWQAGGPRIRAMDARVGRLLAAGLQRSSVVRDLVSRIEGRDVIVYVGLSRTLGRHGLAGSLGFVGQAGAYRYLRAWLNPDLPHDHLVAALAHELRHVIEIIEHAEVRSEGQLVDLYRRIGRQTRGGQTSGWETDAAWQVGQDVRIELARGAATLLARRATTDMHP